MRLFLLFLPLLLVFTLFPVFSIVSAAEVQKKSATCYNNEQYAAEQLVRFHSQLMVIGMVCRPYGNGNDTYAQYEQFTSSHEKLIRVYESRLISLFASEHKKAPEKSLHSLRTNIANDISAYAMNISPKRFCSVFKPRLDKAMTLTDSQLRTVVEQRNSKQISTRPICSLVK